LLFILSNVSVFMNCGVHRRPGKLPHSWEQPSYPRMGRLVAITSHGTSHPQEQTYFPSPGICCLPATSPNIPTWPVPVATCPPDSKLERNQPLFPGVAFHRLNSLQDVRLLTPWFPTPELGHLPVSQFHLGLPGSMSGFCRDEALSQRDHLSVKSCFGLWLVRG
jgi:hypothetical protein